MKGLVALGGGLAGACAVTLVHEVIKKIDPKTAPRMDLLGMNALSKILKNVDGGTPERNKLYKLTLAGDIISNTLYYSLAGMGKNKGVLVKETALGLAAGLGALVLPRFLGLNTAYSNRTAKTKLMTTALYLIGGLVAAATMQWLESKGQKRPVS